MKKFALALAISIPLLSGCGDGSIFSDAAPADLPADAASQLRGVDANENGIRDDIEGATGAMASDLTERLRLLAYAWSMQQGMEVGLLGNDQALGRAAQMMADATECVMQTATNGMIAKSLIDIYMMTADTPLRKDAWAKLQARSASLSNQPGAQPCATADTIATTIVKQTNDKAKAAKEALISAGDAQAKNASRTGNAAGQPQTK